MTQRQCLLESDDDAIKVSRLVQFLSGNLLFGADSENIYGRRLPVMGELKVIFQAVPVFAYDWDVLQERYPIGFHTENAILLSVQTLNSFFNLEDHNDIYHQFVPVMISHMLLDMIENQYTYQFSEKERSDLVSSSRTSYYNKFDASTVKPEKIDFVSWKNIDALVKENSLDKTMSSYENKMELDSKALNTVVFSSKNAVFVDLVNRIQHLKEQETLKFPDYEVMLDEYRKNYNGSGIANNNAYALHVINDKVTKLIEQVKKESWSENEALEKFKHEVYPFMLVSNPDIFAATMENMLFSFQQAGLGKMFKVDNLEKIAMDMSESENLDTDKRSSMIRILTGSGNIKDQKPRMIHTRMY